MDSFESNKVMGAVLGTCLFLLSLNIAASAVFTPHKPAKMGYEVAVLEKAKPGDTQAPAAPEEPIEKLLASASLSKGEASAKKCIACHTFGKGEANLVGPNLYGVVGRPKASEAGFAYSPALKAKGGNWSIDDLSAFLAKPTGFVPGTKMGFVGLPRGTERADVITFLNSKSDSPQPLPKAADAAPAGEKKQ